MKILLLLIVCSLNITFVVGQKKEPAKSNANTQNLNNAVEEKPQVSPTPINQLPERMEVSQNENFGDDIQSGNVVVKATSNGNASVKLGLAQRGVTVIEFPQNDPIYRLYPGDENFVTVDCGVRDKDNRCLNSATDAIVLRPGKLFNQWDEENSATVITVQRVSGIVVSFIILPVKNISQHAFHVVVRYNLSDVISQRKAAGLPFNLANATIESVENDNSKAENSSTMNEKSNSEITALKETSVESEIEKNTISELQKVAADNGKLYFSKPTHGISLALATISSHVSDVVVDVVAVKNTTNKEIRLVPEQPELFVDSMDNRTSISSNKIEIIVQATTAGDDDVLKPNQVYYFAFAYKMPILGVKQILKVGFSQREAADEPAVLTLLGINRDGGKDGK